MLIISGIAVSMVLAVIWALDLMGITADAAASVAMIFTVVIGCLLGAGIWRQVQHYHARHPHPHPHH
jgi:zinc transporter ZupT